MVQNIVVVGAGQAGLQAVVSLRSEGFVGSIVLVGEEPFAPYQRPPLSKAFLLGKMERARLFLKPATFFETACRFVPSTRAIEIDRGAKTVALSNGETLPYDKLILATGTRAKRANVAGIDLPGVHTLRSIADVEALKSQIVPGRRAVIVGGGYVGLEVAAVAAQAGLEVTVIEFLDRVLARSVSETVSSVFEAVHRAHGVRIVTETAVEAFEGDATLRAVVAGGHSFAADFALVGVGAVPNVELARAAGLVCENGIVVDAYATTSDPDIYATGDCAWAQGYDGVWRRLESVQNAIDQARHAALAIVGKPVAYGDLPWFWSDQYDLKLQIAGLARPSDVRVLRGDPDTHKFAEFSLRDGVLAAAVTVNRPADHLAARKLIAAGVRIPTEMLADPDVALKGFL